MARPRKGEEKVRSERVTWRISPSLKEGLDRLATRRGAAMSDIAHDLLEKALHDAEKADQRRAR